MPGRRTGRFPFSLFPRECSCSPLNHLKDFLKILFETHNPSSTEISHVFMILQAQLSLPWPALQPYSASFSSPIKHASYTSVPLLMLTPLLRMHSAHALLCWHQFPRRRIQMVCLTGDPKKHQWRGWQMRLRRQGSQEKVHSWAGYHFEQLGQNPSEQH